MRELTLARYCPESRTVSLVTLKGPPRGWKELAVLGEDTRGRWFVQWSAGTSRYVTMFQSGSLRLDVMGPDMPDWIPRFIARAKLLMGLDL